MISIHVLKICNKVLIIYKKCLEKGCFPSEWKKGNVVPVHKKNDNQLLKNYRPISLLPICGKVLERLLYNSIFEFFIQKNLSTSSPVLRQVTRASINLFPSLTKYANHLMTATKCGLHFLIYRRHLAKYGTKVVTTN